MTPSTSLLDDLEFTARPLPPCPSCCSTENSIRSGFRRTKTGSTQLYLCRNCSKRYTARSIRHTKYPARHIVAALTLFNLGNTLAGTLKEMRRRYKIDIPLSTLNGWVNRYAAEFPFTKLRRRYELDPAQVIRTRRFLHSQVYDFRYHSLKLNIHGRQFPGLKAYLHALEKGDDEQLSGQSTLFDDSHRCSDSTPEMKKRLPPPKSRHHSDHTASRMAALALTLARTARDRHPKVEEFFLVNDSATVATEVPVYLTSSELRELGLPDELPVTGHIDILQVRGKRIYVMDYKPEAASDTNAPLQLSLYALCLSRRTGIPLESIRCAYFDENDHFEFRP